MCGCAQERGDLRASLQAALAAQGLQPAPATVSKALQLWDTMRVRFGVMLVGPAGAGKSTCLAALQAAVTQLRQQAGHPDEQFQVCFLCWLAPLLGTRHQSTYAPVCMTPCVS
jgi:dynein heavy chain